jgi:hypothetical protein
MYKTTNNSRVIEHSNIDSIDKKLTYIIKEYIFNFYYRSKDLVDEKFVNTF